MSLAYLAATESGAGSFVPTSGRELATGLLAGLYAAWRWRSGVAALVVGILGAKAPVLTGLGLVAHGVVKARSER